MAAEPWHPHNPKVTGKVCLHVFLERYKVESQTPFHLYPGQMISFSFLHLNTIYTLMASKCPQPRHPPGLQAHIANCLTWFLGMESYWCHTQQGTPQWKSCIFLPNLPSQSALTWYLVTPFEQWLKPKKLNTCPFSSHPLGSPSLDSFILPPQSSQVRAVGGMNWEIEIDIYTLSVHILTIDNWWEPTVIA